jgi:hypothetical protein
MANQINAIAPYWLEGVHTWVFDDDRVGLVQEPFVFGADLFLSYLAKDIPNAPEGFRLLFSSAPFPGYQVKVRQTTGEMGGTWYESDDPPMKGWLCPALFRYFDTAPAEIYVKAEAIPSSDST